MTIDHADAYEALMQFLYRAPIGLVQTDLDGTIEMINPMSAQLLMPLSADGGLDNLFDVLHRVAPQLRSLAAGFGHSQGIVCEALRVPVGPAAGSDAGEQTLSVSVMKLDELRFMTVLSDVTAEVQREQMGLARRLSDAARTDALTRMPNRMAVRESIEQALARIRVDGGPQFAVLFMNCDRFRQINDTLGHAAGDEVLSLVADRLRSTLRQRDRASRVPGVEPVAGRLGGDEFVVVLDDLRRAEDVHPIAQRLLDVLAKPFAIGEHQVHCNVSLGVVLPAQAAGDADAVMQDASIAMVEAKRAGGGRYAIFEPAMQERVARRGTLEAELRVAIDTGQLFVVYQPVVGLQGGQGIDRSAGVEALVRWRHPVRGIVPPQMFIGVAEECGLIGRLGDLVLATACRQLVKWQRDLGPDAPATMAVNLSRAQLAQPGLVDSVRDVLHSTGLNPRHLQLEVTESVAAQDDAALSRLHQLKSLGLTLALDDFGTGYSSLASLHQMPIDTVKIDRSFVSQADTSHHHRVLIEATVRVADSLGMTTVAEGIETRAQLDVVQSLGCTKGQGYFFSKPIAAGEVGPWIGVLAAVPG